MKTSFKTLLAALALAASLAACNDDTLSPDGKGSLLLNLAMPTNAASRTVVTTVNVSITGPDYSKDTTLTTTSSNSTARSVLTLNELMPGNYSIAISPAPEVTISGSKFILSGSNTVTKRVGADSTSQQTIRYSFYGDLNGILGEWKSLKFSTAAYPYAADVDSMKAFFNSDLTYSIETYKGGAVDSTFSGTYKQTGSSGQRTVELYQTSPVADTLKGVGRSFIANSDTMRLQVVTSGTAPSGFGSQSALQSFRRIKY